MQDLSLMHLVADDLAQPLVPRQSEQIIDMVGLAPAHQFFAAEAAGGPTPAAHIGTALTQLRYDTAARFDRTGSRVLVGRPEPRTQQLVTREDIQRQIAVAVVVAMEETLRLMAVDRDVGRPELRSHMD